MEKGVQRWIVDISKWNPTPHHFSFALSVLPQHEHSSITRYWSLKEAYVKALGSGLVNGLDRVEFHHTNWTNIFVKIDGKPMTEWRFWLFELQKRHWVSVAKGHPKAATESYKNTISRLEYDEEEYHKGLYLPNVRFVARAVEQLIPVADSSDDRLNDRVNNMQR